MLHGGPDTVLKGERFVCLGRMAVRQLGGVGPQCLADQAATRPRMALQQMSCHNVDFPAAVAPAKPKTPSDAQLADISDRSEFVELDPR